MTTLFFLFAWLGAIFIFICPWAGGLFFLAAIHFAHQCGKKTRFIFLEYHLEQERRKRWQAQESMVQAAKRISEVEALLKRFSEEVETYKHAASVAESRLEVVRRAVTQDVAVANALDV